MGRIRKVMSIGTLGLVRFRNAQEKATGQARKANRIAKQQLKIDRQIAAQQAQQAAQQPAPVAPAAPPAGWYPDPQRPDLSRWWDGAAWGPQTQPRQ